jgi:hypothetical protein
VGGDIFHLATVFDESAIATVHAQVLRRLLQSFMHRGLLAEDGRKVRFTAREQAGHSAES